MDGFKHSSGNIAGKGGIEIFFQCWTVDSPKALLLLLHGLGEHSGRYMNIINELKNSRVSIFAMDHRGHGKSSGRRGYTSSFGDYIYDIRSFAELIRHENCRAPLFVLGHSLGGIMAAKFALEYPEDCDGLILSSPAFVPSIKFPKWKIALSGVISKYLPGLAMSNGINPSELSTDQNAVEAYENDPLVHDRATARLYTETMAAASCCLDHAGSLSMPLLVFHGECDSIISPSGSERFFKASSSVKKEIIIFKGMFHETMNEADFTKVTSSVKTWILKSASKISEKGHFVDGKSVKAKTKASKPATQKKKKPAQPKKQKKKK
jgi:alpha-beta hydrolase superfamily lysophospholipase